MINKNTFFMTNINNPRSAFNHLGKLYEFASSNTSSEIILDFSKVRWIESHFSALLFAVDILCDDFNKQTIYSNIKYNIKDIFIRIGLLGKNNSKTGLKNIIPLKFFNLPDENASKVFAKYTEDNFRRILNLSNISIDLENIKDEILNEMDELFSNAELHSKTEHGIITAGQFFPSKKKFDFVIVDLGIGFQNCIQNKERLDNPNFSISPSDAIEWAFQDGNTTRMGDIPGGLGLKNLKNFIVKNRGSLSIFSHGGFWSYTAGRISKCQLKCNLPLTVVIIEVKTDNGKTS